MIGTQRRCRAEPFASYAAPNPRVHAPHTASQVCGALSAHAVHGVFSRISS